MIYEEQFDLANIPRRFREIDPKRFNPAVRDTIKNYVANIETMFDEGWGLYLWGSHGGGKTAIACYLLSLALRMGRKALFILASDTTPYFMEKTPLTANLTYSERIGECDMLVIDDLVVKDRDNYSDSLVEKVIRKRVNDKKITILTTNLKPKTLEENHIALSVLCLESMAALKVDEAKFREEKQSEIAKLLQLGET